ncbi:hypothetical protein [Bartonella sp. DGB1]|uniref:hypothetical protein n=1 Tax=Bartonella sp. DGB1 TaxID=3239807 RepID=UPI003525A803
MHGALVLTDDAFSSEYKRISNLEDAKHETDAVNVKTAESLINENLKSRLGEVNEHPVAIAIGNNTNTNHSTSIAIGNAASAKDENSLAFGNDANAQAGGIAIGNNSFANGNVVSFGKKGLERRLTNVDKGINDTDVINIEQLNNYALYYDGKNYDGKNKKISNVAKGEKDNDAATLANLNHDKEKLEQDIADVMHGALALTDDAFSSEYKRISNLADAKHETDAVNLKTAESLINENLKSRLGEVNEHPVAIAIGNNTNTNHSTSIAIGNAASAKDENSLAFGNDANAQAGGIAIGNNSFANGNVVSFGKKGLERRLTNVDKGINDTDVINIEQLNNYALYHDGKNYDGKNKKISNVAKGEKDNDAATLANLNYYKGELERRIANVMHGALVLTDDAFSSEYKRISNLEDAKHETDAVNVKTAKSLINKNVETRLGKINEKSIEGALVIGNNALADHINAIAIGNAASAKDENSLAFGDDANAQAGGIAIGNNSFANGNVVSFGKKGLERRLTNVDKGINDTDVINIEQLNNYALYYDGKNYDGKNKKISNVAKGEKDNDAATLANLNHDKEKLEQDIADVMHGALALTDDAFSSEYKRISNLADAEHETDAVNVKTAKSLINKNVETRLGKINEKSIKGALVIGNNALADHINAIAIGNAASAKDENSLAFGNDANAQAGGIAIGNNSFANGNVVSFGKKGLERRLTNVDKGINDTDVINIEQLNNYALYYDGKNYDGKNKKISNVAKGEKDNDAATLANLNHDKEKLEQDIADVMHGALALTDDAFSSEYKRISNLEDAEHETDAVNLKTAESLINENLKSRLGEVNEHPVAIAIGNNTNTNHSTSIAIGNAASAKDENSLAFGNDANAQAGGIAIGNNSFANGNVVSFGKKGLERRLTNVDKGINDTDVINIEQLNNYALYYDGKNYDGKNKKISNVAKGEKDNDVINMKQLNEFAIYLNGKNYNANNKTINNVKDGSSEHHAINVGQINRKKDDLLQKISTLKPDGFDTSIKITVKDSTIIETIKKEIASLSSIKNIDIENESAQYVSQTLLLGERGVFYNANSNQISNLGDADENETDAVKMLEKLN